MAQVTRTERLNNITNVDALDSADGKVSKAEFQKVARDQADSSQDIGPAAVMSGTTYDCATGTWKTKDSAIDWNLAIANPKIGEFYFLKKTGAGTCTLPTGGHSFPMAGNVVPAGTWEITFAFDGSNYSFSYSQKTII